MASKKADYIGAIAVLFESSRELLKRGESGSGIDLAMYMVDILEASGIALGDLERGLLHSFGIDDKTDLFAAYSADHATHCSY
jgi:hypothetical protein